MLEEITRIQEVDDSVLIKKAKEGDAEAFGDLYERYAESIFRFVYSQTSNRFDAEDITADVFLRAWNSLSRYEERGFSFSAYLALEKKRSFAGSLSIFCWSSCIAFR